MEGPRLSTATALLLLMLSLTAETAVLKSSTSETVPSTTETSGMAPSTTKASGTVPSTTKVSGTIPSPTQTSGTLPSPTIKASGTVPSPTIKTSIPVPSPTKASRMVPTSSTIASQQERPGTGSMQEPQPTEAHKDTRGPPGSIAGTPSTSLGNEPLCPKTCQCTYESVKGSLEILNCTNDPRDELESLFEKYQLMKKLLIKSSHLTILPNSVCKLTNLEILSLPHNQLEDYGFPWYCLGQLNDLRQLNLSHNLFKVLQQPIDGFQSLQKLSIDNNQLDTIGHGVFREIHNMHSLQSINLQSNLLKSIDSWPLLSKGAAIHLDRNQISNFTNIAGLNVRCNATSSYVINLKGNLVSHLTDMFNGWGITEEEQQRCILSKSRKINLDHNPFNCDCIDYNIYKMMHTVEESFHSLIFCEKPEALHRSRIIDVPLDKFSCSIKESCPDGCNCTKTPNQATMVINCTGNGMSRVPDTLPELPDGYSYNLQFSHNSIQRIDNTSYFHLVKQAVFSHNAVGYITKFALLTLENVTDLFLDHNQLFYLPENILGDVDMTNHFHMKLGENPYMCDCYAKETRKWILKMGTRIIDRDSILCGSPLDVKGRNIPRMTDGELKCGYEVTPDYAFYFGVGVATVAVWMVIIGIPTGILYANRLTLFRKYGWHMFNNDECYGEYKEFDIFLAYAEVNVDYAIEKLFVELENKGYKVAYHRINFIGGKPIKVNIEECIRKSKRSIVVISKLFFNSEWCRCELMTALDIDKKQNTKRLIGILLEEIDDVPELDPKVKKFIKKDHCLRLGEELFEDKMEYMLARKKLRDQRRRRPAPEQLRPRQQRRRQPAANNAHNQAENPPAAQAPAGAAANLVVREHDRANLLDNEQ